MGGASDREMAAFGLTHKPAQDVTQAEVENEILRLCAKLEKQTDELAGRAVMAAESEANHKVRRARAFLEAEGTDSKRAAAAEVVAHDAFAKRKATEAIYESMKQAVLSTRVQLDALRTISANIRSQT